MADSAGNNHEGYCTTCGKVWDEKHQRRRDAVDNLDKEMMQKLWTKLHSDEPYDFAISAEGEIAPLSRRAHALEIKWAQHVHDPEPIVNATERPEDTIRRYAGHMLALTAGLQARGVDLVAADSGGLVILALAEIDRLRELVASYEMSKAGDKPSNKDMTGSWPVISGMEISIPPEQNVLADAVRQQRLRVERNSGEII